jgi:hypothetical protein
VPPFAACTKVNIKLLHVLKSGSLNLLEPSGPVEACSGIALPYIQKKIRICTGDILETLPEQVT